MDCITKGLKNEIGIYKITNLNNQKCYIGQSIELKKRYRSHRNALRTNKHPNNHLQNAFNKGDKFTFEVIELCSTDELDNREITWIGFFESTNRLYGYNFESGGYVNRQKHPETIQKHRKRMLDYFSDETKRIELSKKRTTISLSKIKEIKIALRFTELDCSVIAKRLNVKESIVTHICQIDCHYYICEEYNDYLKNRYRNIESKRNRLAIRMYREGCTYQEIAIKLNIDLRNAIKRIQKIKTKHDDRCRLNCINRAITKRTSLINTMYKMGKNTVEISKLLKVSRSTISKAIKDKCLVLFDDIKDTRGKPKPFEYRIKKANYYPITQEGMQLAFVI